MPTVMRAGAYRFFLTLGDCYEPSHVHIQEGKRQAKFWLDPVKVERPGGFKPHEIADIERMVAENRDYLLAEWENLCGG